MAGNTLEVLDTWLGETQVLFPYNNLQLDATSKIVADQVIIFIGCP